MRPDVEKIQRDPGYRQILELDFNNMIPFVLSNIRRRGIISYLYAGFNLGMIILIILYFITGPALHQYPWTVILKQTVFGFLAGSILIIPVHELLHGLVYKVLGARKIIFGADMKQFIFYVTADRYPVSGGELYLLAFTPFVVINAATIVITLVWFPQVFLFSAFVLLAHNVMCIGDFAIANYVHQHAPRKIYNFDEPEEMKSYFYELIH